MRYYETVTDQELLAALEEAKALQTDVDRSWRWITLGAPLSIILFSTGVSLAVLGQPLLPYGTAMWTSALLAIPAGYAWFWFTTPRHPRGSSIFTPPAVRPREAAAAVRAADRAYTAHIMRKETY